MPRKKSAKAMPFRFLHNPAHNPRPEVEYAQLNVLVTGASLFSFTFANTSNEYVNVFITISFVKLLCLFFSQYPFSCWRFCVSPSSRAIEASVRAKKF